MTVPPRVVRFYGNTDYAMQAIGFREIAFVHADKLNDPFDPYFCFETDFGNSYAKLIDYVRQNHKEDIQKFSSRLSQESWDWLFNTITEDLTSMRNSTFILSTCAVRELIEHPHPKDNLYMWSHYADGHRGVAIEFDTALLTKAVSMKNKELIGKESRADDVWDEIHYTKTLPKITCELIYEEVMAHDEVAQRRTKFHEIMKLILRSKSIVWNKEDEWRLTKNNDETDLKIDRLPLLDDETITALYLGCRVSDPLKQSFKSQVKRSFPKAIVYRSKKVNGEFALKFEVMK